MREFYVHIIANPKRTIYTGVTNNLERRMWEHRERINPGFASERGCDLLVHAEPARASGMRSPARRKSRGGGDRRSSR
ncbi:MAG: GIY-YIG nuclease family protein [Thermomicrobiales bacterium]